MSTIKFSSQKDFELLDNNLNDFFTFIKISLSIQLKVLENSNPNPHQQNLKHTLIFLENVDKTSSIIYSITETFLNRLNLGTEILKIRSEWMNFFKREA